MNVSLSVIGKVVKSGNPAEIEIFRDYIEGLTNIEHYSHIVILFWLHKVSPKERLTIKIKPSHDSTPILGIFATRFPARPNPIGLTVVKLVEKKEDMLIVEDFDAEENTPILDVKPYIPKYDQPKGKVILPRWVKKHIQRYNQDDQHFHSFEELIRIVKRYYITANHNVK